MVIVDYRNSVKTTYRNHGGLSLGFTRFCRRLLGILLTLLPSRCINDKVHSPGVRKR